MKPGVPLPEPTSSAVEAPSATTGTRTEVTLRCRGVRGSIPSPGPDTVRYGGNTSCVEIRYDDVTLTLDAGSGIRSLGRDLVREGVKDHALLLTHYHWDHIQGFPFFGPLHDRDSTVHVYGPGRRIDSLRELFERQMDPRFFPVPLDSAAAELRFETVSEGTLSIGGATVHALRVKHPSHVLGYRVEVGGRSVCYVPDNEIEGEGYELGPDWRDRMVRFAGDADVLIHDAMYTEREYRERRGWGHSTFVQALRLAEEAGVGQLLFFHHDPERTDEALDRIMADLRSEGRDPAVHFQAAVEGAALAVGAGS